MNYPPVLYLGFVIIVLMAFLVAPFMLIRKLELPRWQKIMLGFNYYALLLILCTHLGSMGSLRIAGEVARANLETLARVLKTEPVEDVTAALEEYLGHDEGSFYLLMERFPEPEKADGDDIAAATSEDGEIRKDQ